MCHEYVAPLSFLDHLYTLCISIMIHEGQYVLGVGMWYIWIQIKLLKASRNILIYIIVTSKKKNMSQQRGIQLAELKFSIVVNMRALQGYPQMWFDSHPFSKLT